MSFIIRDMVGGELLGGAFDSGPIRWFGTSDIAPINPAPDLQYFGGGESLLQQVYEIVNQNTGYGSIVSYGDPIYNANDDTVTRTVTFSQDAASKARIDHRESMALLASRLEQSDELIDKIEALKMRLSLLTGD